MLKFYYNNKYKAIFFETRDLIYLRLYKGYFILVKDNKKLSK